MTAVDGTDLTDLHDELRAVARDLLGRADGDADRLWRQVVDAGWLGLEVPEALDGAGATFAEVAVVLEEMGRSTSAVPFLGTAVLGVGALLALDAGPGRDDLLRSVAAGEARLAVALAPDADAVRADAPFALRRTDGEARLHGTAEMVLDAPVADLLLLLADDADGGGGPVLVCVDAGAVTVVEQPVLDRTRRLGTVAADGVAIDDAAIWSFAGDPVAAAQSVLDRLAVAVAVDGLGLAEAMLDATVAYVGARHQFDRPIGSFQAVKHACADMHVHVCIGRELATAAVAAVATGSDDAAPAVARAVSYLGAAAVDVVGSALQLHGGIGYTWESGVHVFLKRAVLDRALAGSPAAQRRRLAGLVLPVEK